MGQIYDVSYIGDNAFEDCDNLIELTNPFGPKITFGSNVFANCNGLQTVRINNLDMIPENMFNNCRNILKFAYEGSIYTNGDIINMVKDSNGALKSYENNYDTANYYDFTNNFVNLTDIEMNNVSDLGVTYKYDLIMDYEYTINGNIVRLSNPIKTVSLKNVYSIYATEYTVSYLPNKGDVVINGITQDTPTEYEVTSKVSTEFTGTFETQIITNQLQTNANKITINNLTGINASLECDINLTTTMYLNEQFIELIDISSYSILM